MTLCLAISYGGRSELAAAARELAAEAAAGRLDPADIDESALSGRLSTTRLGIPDPDLVVRTSGESRLSNLLVWQSAYSELCVVEKAWPDFRRADLVETFRWRRRFGGVGGYALRTWSYLCCRRMRFMTTLSWWRRDWWRIQ